MTSATASLTVSDLTRGFADASLDPVQVLEETLAAAERAQDKFRAVAATADRASVLAEALASRERWAAGSPTGPLDGVPVAVKESVPSSGFPRRHGSIAHEPVDPPVSAPLVHRLREAGAIIFATTAMPDFAANNTGISSVYGVVGNAWNASRTPGGSSAGSACLVAAGVAPIAIGTDMGGSVRLPAAHHGLYGFKPTQGLIAYSPNAVRSAGPMARTVDDMELLLSVVGQEDPVDLSCLPGRYAPRATPLDLDGVSVGLVRQMGAGTPGGDVEVAAAEQQASLLEKVGARIVDVDDTGLGEADLQALATYFNAKMLAELHSIPEERRALVTAQVVADFSSARRATALELAQAMDQLESAKSRLLAATSAHDFLVTPVIPVSSYPADAFQPDGSRNNYDVIQYTTWFNQTCQPAGVVPAGLDVDGMPVGAQVVGRRFADADVVAVMRVLERGNVPLSYPFV
ncbi:amidase [Nocardioides bruguierae]|uniref:amidase n=1 Tax=Nocardioides bruguierae TaxID=2945102 RepID=UPI002021BB25|nr:amidase family protein [Nocardioides bruguierae]MCL8025330.1 amidase family protein [Nocardioides bruguierae]